ncbi:MAG: Mov34/MPN/PAD-1 family protein [Nitrospiraceae bacterium]|nr:Mov34/MPN/PAD-1 family protein [Nitrospiraceae bacterium]
MKRVYLSETAFMDLLLGSAEVYKKECLGYLLGYSLDDRFIVEHAFSLQSAKRRHRAVDMLKTNHNKITPILDKFRRLQIVGDFHSHTQYGEFKGRPVPSREDILSMKPDNIYFIIAINNNSKTMNWGENRDGTISGSIGNYFFKLSAYYLNGSEDPRKARIHCPFPPAF